MGRLSRLLRPKSIAVFGGDWASTLVAECDKIGFDGEIWPVSPTRDQMASHKCYSSIEELPGIPDAAFVGVNRQASIEVIDQLAKIGAGGAICFASGFLESEADEAGGAELQEKLIKAAGEMPFIGPNCYGYVNYLDRVVLWPDQHGSLPLAPGQKGVAIISQSSNIAISLTMQQRGLPIAFAATVGNQAQTGLSEIALELIEDEHITALGLYIEGFDDAGQFAQLADRARESNKPIVAYKSGRSEKARQANLSHTASVAGSNAHSDAFFTRLGVGQVSSLDALLETLKLLHTGGPLNGNNVTSTSCSGGEAALVADAGTAAGLGFVSLADQVKSDLAQILGPRVALANPLDYHTYIWGDQVKMTAMFTAMLSTPADLHLLVFDYPRIDRCSIEAWTSAVDSMRTAVQTTDARAALVSTMAENLPEEVCTQLIESGIAPLQGLSTAMAAVRAAADIGRTLALPKAKTVHVPDHPSSTITLSEPAGKQLLKAHGIAIPEGRLVESVGDVEEVMDALTGPLVVKVVGLAHKSEHKGVYLNIEGKTATMNAVEQVLQLTEQAYIEEMAEGAVAELMIGLHTDRQLGHLMTIGAGGVWAELMDEHASLLLPFERTQLKQALAPLKCIRLINGYRGNSKGNIEAVLDVIEALQQLVLKDTSRIEELEINPLIVRAEDAIAVDALVRTGDKHHV